jgi:hypothetical protein
VRLRPGLKRADMRGAPPRRARERRLINAGHAGGTGPLVPGLPVPPGFGVGDLKVEQPLDGSAGSAGNQAGKGGKGDADPVALRTVVAVAVVGAHRKALRFGGNLSSRPAVIPGSGPT